MAQNSITYTDSYTRNDSVKPEGMQSNKDLNDYQDGLKSSETLLKSPKKNMSRNHLDANSPSAIKPTLVSVPRLNISKLKKNVDNNSVEDYTAKQ